MIRANTPFEYTSYDPDPGVLIIEIPEGDVSSLPPSIDLETLQVKRLNIKTIDGTQGEFFIGRFEINYHPGAQSTISMEGSNLHIRIEHKPEVYAEADEEAAHPALGHASQIYGMRIDDSHPSYLDITILGDGKLSYEDFHIEDPDRVVVDLEHVSMNLANNNYEVNNPYVERVRTGQFQIVPEKIGRVVFDMKQPCPYKISTLGNSLNIRFGYSKSLQVSCCE